MRVLPSGRARVIESPRQVLNIRSEPAQEWERGSEDIRTPKHARPRLIPAWSRARRCNPASQEIGGVVSALLLFVHHLVR